MQVNDEDELGRERAVILAGTRGGRCPGLTVTAGVKEVVDASSAPADVADCEEGAITRAFQRRGRSLPVREVAWTPGAGGAVPHVIKPFLAVWISPAVPITLTYVNVGSGRRDKWVLWTVTAESAAMVLRGYPGQVGVYMARAVTRATELGSLQGAPLGAFREGSAAYWAAVDAAIRADGHSYLFATRRANGCVRLWDGSTDREGGMRGVNSYLGTDRTANAALAWQTAPGDFSEDATLHAVRAIKPVHAGLTLQEWAAREILIDYGAGFGIPPSL